MREKIADSSQSRIGSIERTLLFKMFIVFLSDLVVILLPYLTLEKYYFQTKIKIQHIKIKKLENLTS